VAALPPATRDELGRDAGLVEDAMRAGLSRGRNTSATTYGTIWATFRQQLGMAPNFAPGEDPIPWLQIFGQRVRDGRLSASGNPVGSGQVADALLFVAQAHTMLGAPDPRKLTGSGTIDPRLSRQISGYHKKDPPPARVKPLPIPLLRHAQDIATAAGDAESLAAADMMWIAFFFLLRPGEYTRPSEDTHPFRMGDVHLWINQQPLDYQTATEAQFLAVNFIGLEFTTQKNGTKGEVIGHGRSLDPFICPVASIIRRLRYLRSIDAPRTTFLCAFQRGSSLKLLESKTITILLQQACLGLGNSFGFTAADISAKSLRASGAMALLNEKVDRNVIQLIGRWKSDTMLRYLHVQAHNLMSGFSQLMLEGGNFALIPNELGATLPTFTS
jgi:hypothetical protein